MIARKLLICAGEIFVESRERKLQGATCEVETAALH
jgi:hypothetical protein